MTMALSTPTTRNPHAIRSRPIAIVVTIFAWASAFPAIRAGLAAFGPLELGAVRFAIAAVPAAIFLAVTRPALPERGEVWRFGVGGVGFVALYTGAAQYRRTDRLGGRGQLHHQCQPDPDRASSRHAFLGERFSRRCLGRHCCSPSPASASSRSAKARGCSFDAGALLILGAALRARRSTRSCRSRCSRATIRSTVSAWNMVVGALALSPFLPTGLQQAAVADARTACSR